MNKAIAPLLLILLLAGCNESTNQRPYIAGQKPAGSATSSYLKATSDPTVKVATIEAESRKEIAQIQKERDLELERIRTQTKSKEIETLKEVELKKQETLGQQEANVNSRYNTAIIIGSLFLSVILGIIIYFLLKRREDKLKIHKETLDKEISLKEKELQVQMATKILDAVASGNLDKEDEKRLIETLEKSNKILPHRH
jgi:hypothetical protein